MTRSPRSLTALLAICMLTTGLGLMSPSAAGAQSSECTTDTYGTADEARANYGNDCGQPFQYTNSFRCDWVPGGWQCSGPGTEQARSSTTPAKVTVATPYISEAKYNGSFVGVKWVFDSAYTKVEIYRDLRNGLGLQYVTTVDSGNVFNDYIGRPHHIYQVLAHDRDGSLSGRSNFLVATGANTYDISTSDMPTQIMTRQSDRRNPFTVGPTLEQLDSKSPAKAQNQEMLRRYKDMLQRQQDDWQYIQDLKAAEEWDREQAAKRAAEEKAAEEKRKREEEQRRDNNRGSNDCCELNSEENNWGWGNSPGGEFG